MNTRTGVVGSVLFMSILDFVVIVFLLLVNALYVGAEFAIVGVRKSQLRQMEKKGSSLVSSVIKVVEHPELIDRFIAACQVGITLSSLVLGAYAQASVTPKLVPVFMKYTGTGYLATLSVCAVFVLIVLTVVQVVFAELVPKSFALQFPIRSALYTFIPVNFSQKIFSPLITLLNGSGSMMLKVFGITAGRHRHIHSPEEIDMLIAESRDGGVLEDDEKERLHKALQLANRNARYLMVPRIKMDVIDVNTPVDQLPGIVAGSPYTRLPVYEGSIDNIIGFIHTKSVVKELIDNKTVSLKNILKPILKVPRNIKGDGLLSFLRKNRGHQALVIDEYGGVEGIVTLDDLLGEMLGDIGDELKREEIKPEKLDDFTVRLPGFINAEDAEGWLGIHLKGQSDTIGGIITDYLGHLPVEGEKVILEQIEFLIEKVSDNAVMSVIARLPQTKDETLV